ncbi:MAG TPA: competence protein ComJ [Anaerolineales bacterium]|nr:competence protein ComJ [Anaerolineales bacterium]
MKEIESFELSFGYAQVAVFNSNLIYPFNKWQPQHYAQGFSWRPGSVSFRLLDEFGLLQVKVQLGGQIESRPDVIRAILVPFSVDPLGIVEIASVDQDGKQVQVPEDKYALVFETGRTNSGIMWCSFTFVPDTHVKARILLADSDLSPAYPLLMDAEPA